MNDFKLNFFKIRFYFHSVIDFNDNNFESEEFSFNYDLKEKILKIFLKEKKFLDKIEIIYKIENPKNFYFFRNGFSSWSPSFLIDKNHKFRSPPIKALLNHYLYPKELKEKFSYFITYLKNDKYFFIYPESLNFLTYFDIIDNFLSIFFEVDKEVTGEIIFPKIIFIERENPIINYDFNEKIFGWTSWYYYYRKIDKEELIKNIDFLDKQPITLDYFQIDDGWQDSIGDWNENDKFKDSLKIIVQRVNEKRVKPGIWISPFVVQKSSNVFKKRNELILKDKNKNPVPVGFNPLWGGYFYALDINREDSIDFVLEKLSRLKEIGFELFKLDFLYSFFNSFISKGKSYSIYERFLEVFKKIKDILKESKILACGAPYIFNEELYDILRIGPDTKDGWKDLFTRIIGFSGNVEAYNSLRNTLNRVVITPKSFLCDPDVIFLKPKKLNIFERETIIIINYFLSNVIFFSDPLYSLNYEDYTLLKKLMEFKNYTISDFYFKDEIYEFKLKSNSSLFEIKVNLSDKKMVFKNHGEELFKLRKDNTLFPHETRVFKLK